jgi:8-oxo-dGTP pyrophosphatase MutT (NUDIX family)
MKTDELFYVGQKAFIEKDGNILVLYDHEGRLDFPGGKIQEGEADFDMSLQREVLEETGLEIKIGSVFHRYFFINKDKKIFIVGIACTWLSGEVVLSSEHKSYKWVSKETYKELQDNSVDYQALHMYFEKYGRN